MHTCLIHMLQLIEILRSETERKKFNKQFKNIEENSINNEKRHTMYKRKWQQVENVLKTKTF